MPRRLHVAVLLVRTAAMRPPSSLQKKVQFLLPTAIPRRLRSAPLLSISRSPSSQYRQELNRAAAALEPKFLKNVLVITPEAADGTTVP